METRRQRLLANLRERPMTPTELATEFETTPAAIVEDLEHVSRSLESTADELLVAPPSCRDCGFDGFDDLLNRPSRCPECNSENVAELAVTVG